MITKLLVVQKIEEDGNVNVFQAASENFQWTFETERSSKKEKTREYFPFIIFGDAKILKRKSGRETKTIVKENNIMFQDDYGVPEGTVIGILPPKNFIPDIIKFKDTPYVPVNLVGQISTTPPAQIQILYNEIHKKCAIIIHINQRQLFGIHCSFKQVSNEQFPKASNTWRDELFDISISRELLNIDAIKTEDLKILNETINIVDLTEVNAILNEILLALKTEDKTQAKNKLTKFGKIIFSITGTTANLAKTIDSLSEGGAINKFVKQVLKYISIDHL